MNLTAGSTNIAQINAKNTGRKMLGWEGPGWPPGGRSLCSIMWRYL